LRVEHRFGRPAKAEAAARRGDGETSVTFDREVLGSGKDRLQSLLDRGQTACANELGRTSFAGLRCWRKGERAIHAGPVEAEGDALALSLAAAAADEKVDRVVLAWQRPAIQRFDLPLAEAEPLLRREGSIG
jgi:hypothetical protein